MSKLAKQRGQALTPRFVNNGHGTAEITYSTARACHEVPACSRDAVCSSRCGLHRESPGCSARGLHWGDIAILLPGAMLWLCYGSVTGMLWLLPQRCASQENKCVCGSSGSASLVPASQVESCLAWLQRTLWTVRTARQLAS